METDFQIIDTGAVPLIARLCDAVGLGELVNHLVPWDQDQCALSPGTRIKASIINCLTARKPLYVEVFFSTQDTELLFGQGVSADQFNDDALARALDKLAEANPRKVFCPLALQAITIVESPVKAIHVDTTCISLSTKAKEN